MPNSIKKVAKVGSKILPITKKPLKIAIFIFLSKREFSLFLVTLTNNFSHHIKTIHH